jgi:hypothetical protein
VGGTVTGEGATVMAREGVAVMPVPDRPLDLRDAMASAGPLVCSAGERLARLIGVGFTIGAADRSERTANVR